MHVLRFIVANNILRLRTDAEMSRAELGDKIRYSEDYILKWERAEEMPDDDAVAALAEVFGVDAEYLLNPHDEWVSKEEKAYLENTAAMAPAVETKNLRREGEKAAEEPEPADAEAPVKAFGSEMLKPIAIITGSIVTMAIALFVATGGSIGCASELPEDETEAHVHEYVRWEAVSYPTALTEGEMRKYCYGCDDYIVRVLPASTQGLFYDDHGDGTCTVIGVGHSSETPLDAFKTIVIPQYIADIDSEGNPIDLRVVAIGDGFLGSLGDMYLENVQEIILPDTVRSIGGYAFSGTAINSIVLPKELTSIGEYAFAHCENLYEIDIPDSVESMGEGVFKGCTSLNRVEAHGIAMTEIPSYTFKDCTSLYAAYLGGGVTVVNEYAFENCTSLKDFYVGSLSRIERAAFKGCYAIDSILLPDTVECIGESAFEGCTGIQVLEIDGGETPLTIERNAFRGCIGIKTAGRDNKLPDRIECIGEYAFADCASLDWLFLNVQEILPNAFEGCTALRGVTFGEKVKYIGKYAFSGCASISYIELPSSVRRVMDYAFKDCAELKRFQTFGKLEYIGAGVFDGCENLIALDLYDITEGNFMNTFRGNKSIESVSVRTGTVTAYAFENCTALQGVVLGEGVTVIGQYAFAGCTALSEVRLPEGLTRIDDYAFFECAMLEVTSFPESVTLIGEYAFAKSGVSSFDISSNTYIDDYAFYGSALRKVKLSSNETRFGDYVFADCYELGEIVVEEGVTTIYMYMFSGCENYNLGSITLPESVAHIYAGAFEKCNWLTEITIKNPNISIGAGAFYYCQHLQKVSFGGTMEDVYRYTGSIGTNLKRTEGIPSEITVVCADGEVVIRK